MRAVTSVDVTDAVSLRHIIAVDGAVHIKRELDKREFRLLCSELGYVVAEEDIALRKGAHAYVAKPGGVPFHTDQPQVETIGWWCREQDADDGASLLIDSEDVLAGLDHEMRWLLSTIMLATPPVSGGPPRYRFPIVREDGIRTKFFCSPWLKPVSADPRIKDTLDEVQTRIRQCAAERVFSVRLKPGEALIVDNQRMLHGRDAIGPQSKRQLKRFWMIAA